MKKMYVISARTEQNRTEPKKVFVMLLLMFFISTLIHAQLITYHCATDSSFFVPKALDCTPNSDAWINTYRLQESYVPKSINPWVGHKTIPVNIIFFGEDNGTGFPLLNGQVVKSNIFLSPQSTTIIPLSGLKSGIYILKCSDEKGNVQTHKIIKN